MKFKEKLKQLRIQHNLKQSDIAELCSVTRSAVSNWESGLRFPEIESVTILAKFFNISIEELLGTDQTIMNLKEIEKDISDTNNKISKKVPMMLAISWVVVFALLLILIAPVVKDKYTKNKNQVDIIDVESIEKVVLELQYFNEKIGFEFMEDNSTYGRSRNIYVINKFDFSNFVDINIWGEKMYIEIDFYFLKKDGNKKYISDNSINFVCEEKEMISIFNRKYKINVCQKYKLLFYIIENKYYLEAFLLD